MKVYKGTMYRIIVELACGCKSMQEYKDDLLKEQDGEPRFTACEKHKAKPSQSEILEVILMEALEKEASEAKSQASLAIAQANARRTADPADPNAPAPIGEGATAEHRTTVGNRVVRPNVTIGGGNRPDPTKVKTGTPAGLRRGGAGTSAAALPANKQAAIAATQRSTAPAKAPVAQVGDIDPQVQEDPRVTKYLVDAPGGLLGDDADDPTTA